MFQKYGSNPTRNLLVDRVESTAKAHEDARLDLIAHDYREKTNDQQESFRRTK